MTPMNTKRVSRSALAVALAVANAGATSLTSTVRA